MCRAVGPGCLLVVLSHTLWATALTVVEGDPVLVEVFVVASYIVLVLWSLDASLLGPDVAHHSQHVPELI